MTAIIGIYTPDRILLAADSKETSSNPEEVRGAAIKILQVNSHFFAISGVSENDKTGLNVDEIIKAALSGADDLESKISQLKTNVIPALTQSMQQTYDDEDERDFFNKHYRGSLALQIFVCGVAGGELFIRRLAFKTVLHGETIKVRLFEETMMPRNGSPIPWGVIANEGELLQEFMANIPETEVTQSPELVIEKFMAVAIANNPEMVGDPVDVLEITRTEARWIDKKEICPEIVPYT